MKEIKIFNEEENLKERDSQKFFFILFRRNFISFLEEERKEFVKVSDEKAFGNHVSVSSNNSKQNPKVCRNPYCGLMVSIITL